ncbi:MAG: GH3 auxin-responsive promoter family protein [Candidatus Bathyarchaeota archaeon]|nr:GH3 auxin-responsive promoter family protein [Candidatus Bathyarchaeota archaeon]
MCAQSSPSSFLFRLVEPWYQALKNPDETQNQTMLDLVEHYKRTGYGKQHDVDSIRNMKDYKTHFPKLSYKGLQPYLKRVKMGDYNAILSEPPLCWVMTRGSTGVSKTIPATETHLEQIFSCGARALINYALRKGDLDILTGNILNLNFPSAVRTMNMAGETVTYGYSSGTYARLNPMLQGVRLLPKQEDIDALGPGITLADWERRFELVIQKAASENITATMGVTPVILAFAKYLLQKHQKRPKELWQLRALFCTSVRKIHSRYAPKLRHYFGSIPILEMYTATEGVYGQQLDELPYFSPNYDKYLFEVETGKGLRMLHELKRGEWGRLVVSSCLFPRYQIGDMIEAMGNNYFRVFGRATKLTILEHRLFRLLYGWLL